MFGCRRPRYGTCQRDVKSLDRHNDCVGAPRAGASALSSLARQESSAEPENGIHGGIHGQHHNVPRRAEWRLETVTAEKGMAGEEGFEPSIP